MFERFTDQARVAVVTSRTEARSLGHALIGTEHLLLALLNDPHGLPARLVAEYDLDHDRARHAVVAAHRPARSDELDAEALWSIGIDLDLVRELVEESFGTGAFDAAGSRTPKPRGLRFSPRAKKVLQLALREAIAMRSPVIESGHLLLGLLREGQGLGATVLHGAGVDLSALADRVRVELRRAS
jgi:ATP-dependent Clp protease ATP-binding subunit ClpA